MVTVIRTMKQIKHSLFATILGGIMAFLLSSTFIWLQVTSPSDGVRLEPGEPVWRPNGVVVTPLTTRASALQDDDLVTAIAGRGMDFWVQALFWPGMPRPQWHFGQVVTYTVVRNERPLDIVVMLERYPIGIMIAKNWSALVFALSAQLVTAYVLFRRPDNSAAQALFLWCWSLANSMTWLLGLHPHDVVGGIGFWLYVATTIGVWHLVWGAGLHFVLVFPQPHGLVLRHPGAIRLVYLAPYLLSFGYMAGSRLLAANTLEWLSWSSLNSWHTGFLCLAVMIFVLLHQYRTSHGAMREKMRWLVFVSLLSGGGGLLLWFLPAFVFGHMLLTTQALGLLLVPIPVGLAVAILRDRLFDLDIIIRRTLVYSTLTGILALVYFCSVVLLQTLLHTFTGEVSQLVIVVSTLVIATLFIPLRQRIQTGIDRRFYRRRYNAEQVLASFGRRLHNETDIEQLRAAVVAVVEETLQPTHVSLWLPTAAASHGRSSE
jgi:hypothetical protein